MGIDEAIAVKHLVLNELSFLLSWQCEGFLCCANHVQNSGLSVSFTAGRMLSPKNWGPLRSPQGSDLQAQPHSLQSSQSSAPCSCLSLMQIHKSQVPIWLCHPTGNDNPSNLAVKCISCPASLTISQPSSLLGMLNSTRSRDTESRDFTPKLVTALFPPWVGPTSWCVGPHISPGEWSDRERKGIGQDDTAHMQRSGNRGMQVKRKKKGGDTWLGWHWGQLSE